MEKEGKKERYEADEQLRRAREKALPAARITQRQSCYGHAEAAQLTLSRASRSDSHTLHRVKGGE